MISILIKILSSQICGNMIQIAILFITTVALFIAIKTYQADVKQKRLKNTIEYIHLFLEGNWISQQDKKLWNKFFRYRLCRNACGDFALTGKFIVDKGFGKGQEHIDVLTIFSEGQFQHYGKAIINVLNVMEYVAQKVLNGELDLDLIKIQTLRFYQLADFYNDILSKDTTIEFYPKCKKLYNKISQCLKNDEPYGNYCEFPIENNSIN